MNECTAMPLFYTQRWSIVDVCENEKENGMSEKVYGVIIAGVNDKRRCLLLHRDHMVIYTHMVVSECIIVVVGVRCACAHYQLMVVLSVCA